MGIKRNGRLRGKQCQGKRGGGELCVYMRRKMQDKGKYVWVKKLFLPSLEHLAVTAG